MAYDIANFDTGHESPYLNQGNTETKLKPGMLFTSEPGVYIWNKLGVRHEDVILVTEGKAECLSCGFDGRRPDDPWEI
jgi:Xaa-Pro aminopeptidase